MCGRKKNRQIVWEIFGNMRKKLYFGTPASLGSSSENTVARLGKVARYQENKTPFSYTIASLILCINAHINFLWYN